MVHSTSASRPRRHRLAAVLVAVVLGAALPVVAGAVPAAAADVNLALGRPLTANSALPFPAYYANDGNPYSYWESPLNSPFPQLVTVDLGSLRNVFRVVLKLPPQAAQWPARTQTISVVAGADIPGTVVAPTKPYTFDPATGNAVTIEFAPGYRRYVRLIITGNSGWPAAQLSEFEVYEIPPPPPPPPALSITPSGLDFGSSNVGTRSPAKVVTIANAGGPATLGAVTVTGDFERLSTTCGVTLGAGSSCTATVAFTPTTTGPRTGVLSVNSLSIPLSGTGVPRPVTNLALGRQVTADSANGFVPMYAVDGNPNSVWESPANVFPQLITVDLGQLYQVSRVVLKLPPGASWPIRTQTLTVAGAASPPFTTLVNPAGYVFNPATQNTVTITFPVTTMRYLRLTVTGNSAWPAAQLAELEVYAS